MKKILYPIYLVLNCIWVGPAIFICTIIGGATDGDLYKKSPRELFKDIFL